MAVVGLGQLLALGLGPGSSPWRLLPSLVVSGLATGVLNAVLGREAVATVPADRAAMGSGSNNTARYLGAACGITVFSVLMGARGDGVGPAAWSTGGRRGAGRRPVLSFAGAALIGAIAAYSTNRYKKARGVTKES